MCDVRDLAKCEAEVGEGKNLEWTCAQCGKIREADIHPYTRKITRIRRRRLAGYPFRANDLTPEEWDDLGLLEEYETRADTSRPRPVMMVRMKE